jgi:hypothetical protein
VPVWHGRCSITAGRTHALCSEDSTPGDTPATPQRPKPHEGALRVITLRDGTSFDTVANMDSVRLILTSRLRGFDRFRSRSPRRAHTRAPSGEGVR